MSDLQNTKPNNSSPIVSFIITYYQVPVDMLCECIDSILSLSLRHFEREIIIIDDGSKTSPINDLIKYEDDIIYVRQKNMGLSVARNTGLDIAKGNFIQFVDADDQLIQAPYEQCLDIIRYQNKVDMVLFDFTTRLPVQIIPENAIPTNGSTYMRNHNIHGSAWGYLFRRSILGELRFTPGIYHEDEEFTPQLLLRAEEVYPTNLQAYWYRPRQNSITSSTRAEDIDKRIQDSETVIVHLHELCDKLPHQDRMALERRVAQLTMDHIYSIIIQTRSATILQQRIDILHSKGLFPLPEGNFTSKYKWFRRMVNTSVGRHALLHILPLMHKER